MGICFIFEEVDKVKEESSLASISFFNEVDTIMLSVCYILSMTSLTCEAKGLEGEWNPPLSGELQGVDNPPT